MLRVINSHGKEPKPVNSIVLSHTPRQSLASSYTFVDYLLSLVSSAFVYFTGRQQIFMRSVAYSTPYILLDAEGSPPYLKVSLKGMAQKSFSAYFGPQHNTVTWFVKLQFDNLQEV